MGEPTIPGIRSAPAAAAAGARARLSLPAAPLWDWAPTSAAACGSPPPSAGFRRCVRPPDVVPDLGRASVPAGRRAVASQIGPLARCVDDLAIALSIINALDLDHEAVVPLADYRDVDIKRLRVAVLADDGAMTPSLAIARGLREAAGPRARPPIFRPRQKFRL
jgi:hypothetical protein